MKHGCILFMALAVCSLTHGQMYRCDEPGVRVSYSDMPCTGGSEIKSAAPTYQKTWQDRLKLQKPPGITITEMKTVSGETNIEYTFKVTAQSNIFMKLASKLSGVNGVMMNLKMPKGNRLGRAKVVIGKNVTVL